MALISFQVWMARVAVPAWRGGKRLFSDRQFPPVLLDRIELVTPDCWHASWASHASLCAVISFLEQSPLIFWRKRVQAVVTQQTHGVKF